MDIENGKHIKKHILDDITYEELMGYEPSSYDLFVNVEDGICLFKNKQINLRKSHLEYLKLVIKNTKKGKYTFSKDTKDTFDIEAKSVDKMKEIINEEFKKHINIEDIEDIDDFELIVNRKGYGNKINERLYSISAC